MRIGSTLGSNTYNTDPNSYLGGFSNAMRARQAKRDALNNFNQAIDDKKNFSTSATNRAPEQAQPKQPTPFDPEAAIQKVVQDTAAYLDFKIGRIFEEDKSKLLSGKSDVDYQNSLDELTKAIEGQDYGNAKIILAQFYQGDSDQVISKIEDTLNQVEDKFWKDIKNVLGQMRDVQGLTLTEGVSDQNATSDYDIIEKAIENARQKTGSLSDTDFSSLIAQAREDSVEYAVNRLKNEDRKVQNYTNAEEAIQSASIHAKHFLLNSQSHAGRFTDYELEVSSQIERNINTTKAMRTQRHLIHDDSNAANRFNHITDEEISRSAGLSMSSTSELSSKLQEMGHTVINELKDLLSKSDRKRSLYQEDKLAELDKDSFEIKQPEDFIGNENWRAYREDLTDLMVEGTLRYSDRMTARYKSQQNNGNFANSSFSLKV